MKALEYNAPFIINAIAAIPSGFHITELNSVAACEYSNAGTDNGKPKRHPDDAPHHDATVCCSQTDRQQDVASVININIML